MHIMCAAVILASWMSGAPATSPEPQDVKGAVTQSDNKQAGANAACVLAIPAYQAALQKNPNDAAKHNGLGVCYQQTNHLKQAIKEYQKALKLDNRYAEAWNNLGSAYHGQGKLKRAVEHYMKATAMKPEMAVAHKNLGTALLSQGKVEEGMAAYRRAIELDPSIFENAPPVSFSTYAADPALQYYYFAKLCASKGRVDAALLFLRKARSLGFQDFNKVRRDPDFHAVVSQTEFAAITQ